ncbi:MAG: ribosome small subunit-dependent GTPase A [Mucilaginibacter polytrichastri]|nr:ribosome small subunit-dependent GTPase A [Mucilaginibacter polytrichastri]
MQGLVTKSTGSWYIVRDATGKRFECRIKGKFRMKGLVTTNPVAVGDTVDFELEPDSEKAVITRLHDRRNYIIRKSIALNKQAQVIAANLDQAYLVVTLASPRTSLGFIDRFLVTAEAYDIPAALIFNKLDLFSEEGLEYLQAYKEIYTEIGYPCYEVSAIERTNVDEVLQTLRGKTTLLSGHSGVGKSSLMNAFSPGINQRTKQVSEAHDKGMHTTTFAEMFELPDDIFIIDTPGIRELGIIDIKPEELGYYFPEMRERLNQCRFHNCRHINEPGCVIREAVENGEISESRYDSYLSIFHGNDTRA